MKKVLIFGGVGAPKDAFLEAAKAHNLVCEFATIQSLRCEINQDGVHWSLRGVDLDSIDSVIMRGVHSDTAHRNVVAQFAMVRDFCIFLIKKGIRLFDEGFLEYDTLNKYEMTKRMVEAGVPTIPTRIILTVNDKNVITFPCVVKPAVGSRGKGVVKCETRKEFRAWHAAEPYYPALVQPWVPNTFDLRVVVIDNEVVTTIRRERAEGDINNLSQGSAGTEVEISQELKQIAIHAAKAFKYNITGIDLMQNSQTGEWFVLEVNRSPGFTHTLKLSSVDVLDRIMRMIAKSIA